MITGIEKEPPETARREKRSSDSRGASCVAAGSPDDKKAKYSGTQGQRAMGMLASSKKTCPSRIYPREKGLGTNKRKNGKTRLDAVEEKGHLYKIGDCAQIFIAKDQVVLISKTLFLTSGLFQPASVAEIRDIFIQNKKGFLVLRWFYRRKDLPKDIRPTSCESKELFYRSAEKSLSFFVIEFEFKKQHARRYQRNRSYHRPLRRLWASRILFDRDEERKAWEIRILLQTDVRSVEGAANPHQAPSTSKLLIEARRPLRVEIVNEPFSMYCVVFPVSPGPSQQERKHKEPEQKGKLEFITCLVMISRVYVSFEQ